MTVLETRSPSCPVCGKPAVQSARPFCSHRCRDVDLGRWLAERYVIPGQSTDISDDDPDDAGA